MTGFTLSAYHVVYLIVDPSGLPYVITMVALGPGIEQLLLGSPDDSEELPAHKSYKPD